MQVLKRVFEGTNYKDGPFAVSKFWAVKAVMRYRDPGRSSWHDDAVKSEEPFTLDISSLSSQLAQRLLQEPPHFRPYAVRRIDSLMRAREKVEVLDYLFVERRAGRAVVARVREMMECRVEHTGVVQGFVRLLCDSCVEPRVGKHGELWSPAQTENKSIFIRVEEVHMAVKICNVYTSHSVYN